MPANWKRSRPASGSSRSTTCCSTEGRRASGRLLRELGVHAQKNGVKLPFTANTPYINTIHASEEVPYPGSREIERRIKSLVRWNAMAMVVRANRIEDGIGGHISTFASSATLYEVGFNHFFRGRENGSEGDIVYFQGHASPGIYARAFLEGRISRRAARKLPPRAEARRRPVVLSASLADAGLLGSSRRSRWASGPSWRSTRRASIATSKTAASSRATDAKVWAFLGDGETDEPEALGAITLASRETARQPDLRRSTATCSGSTVRCAATARSSRSSKRSSAAPAGTSSRCSGAPSGTTCSRRTPKACWSRRMGEIVDGEYQKYAVESGAYVRKHFWGADPRLLEMVKHLSDEQLKKLTLGGHDPNKVYNAYKRAIETKGVPTVILARTIKGYGVGESGEGKNVTHQQKKLNDEEVKAFRTRFGIPISDEEVAKAPFYRPPQDSVEINYVQERRAALGGAGAEARRCAPSRSGRTWPKPLPSSRRAPKARKASTTMVFVRMLSKLLRDEQIGKLVVPIVPDEARTFGMEALFRQVGIYAHSGQLYEPVDMDTLLYYKEARGRADSRRGHQRSRLDVVVHRGRHGLCDARHQHDSVLHLLFDVRLPARRRPDLGRLRHADARLRARRHGRPDDAQRRGAAAPGRPEPRARRAGADLPVVRSGVRLRARP